MDSSSVGPASPCTRAALSCPEAAPDDTNTKTANPATANTLVRLCNVRINRLRLLILRQHPHYHHGRVVSQRNTFGMRPHRGEYRFYHSLGRPAELRKDYFSEAYRAKHLVGRIGRLDNTIRIKN